MGGIIEMILTEEMDLPRGFMKRILLIISVYSLAFGGTPYPLYDLSRLHEESDYLFVFCHGFLANRKHGYHYLHGLDYYQGTIPHSLVTFDFPEADTGWQLPEIDMINFGQAADINQLDCVIKALRARFPHKRIILYGVSRGASAIINYLAYKGDQAVDDIALAILESPFDQVLSVVRNLLAKAYLHKVPGIMRFARLVLRKLVPAYKEQGPHPIEQIKYVSSQIPLLFIACEGDDIIKPENTQAVVEAGLAVGHPAISTICLPDGEHGNILWYESGPAYAQAVYDFYQLYDIN